MSEGEIHSQLVVAMIKAITEAAGKPPALFSDCISIHEHWRSPIIGGSRPDVLARESNGKTTIGEAKTLSDIDNLHTRAQFKQFFEHLCTTREGTLWISVPLGGAGEALRVAREVRSSVKCLNVKIVLSGWLIGRSFFERRWID